MKVFCDTNVLVAAFLQTHPHHSSARPVIERAKAGRDHRFVGAHSLAETYAVLTRLPGGNQVAAAVAGQLITENVLKDFQDRESLLKRVCRHVGERRQKTASRAEKLTMPCC